MFNPVVIEAVPGAPVIILPTVEVAGSRAPCFTTRGPNAAHLAKREVK